jgi:hypothetical protein
VADVIGGELRLEAATIAFERGRHDPRVVDEDVQWAPGREELPGEGIDGRGIDEVERLELDARRAGEVRARLVEGARTDDDRRACAG